MGTWWPVKVDIQHIHKQTWRPTSVFMLDLHPGAESNITNFRKIPVSNSTRNLSSVLIIVLYTVKTSSFLFFLPLASDILMVNRHNLLVAGPSYFILNAFQHLLKIRISQRIISEIRKKREKTNGRVSRRKAGKCYIYLSRK